MYLDIYGNNENGYSKTFKDSNSKCISVGFHKICKSLYKAKKLGELAIGETYTDYTGRTFTRIS